PEQDLHLAGGVVAGRPRRVPLRRPRGELRDRGVHRQRRPGLRRPVAEPRRARRLSLGPAAPGARLNPSYRRDALLAFILLRPDAPAGVRRALSVPEVRPSDSPTKLRERNQRSNLAPMRTPDTPEWEQVVPGGPPAEDLQRFRRLVEVDER